MAKTNENMQSLHDKTIVAWATALGRSGVAVLRISGAQADELLLYLGVTALPAPRIATLVKLYHPDTRLPIDHCLCLRFPAPHSFTGESVVELHTHGSLAVTELLTNLLIAHPSCRLAEPGEFSRRAFHNQKMDLIQAEGLAALIDAETEAQHRQAMRQMQGEVGHHYHSFRTRIIEAMAMMEAYIDFPDEDIPEHVTEHANHLIRSLKSDIELAMADRGIGEKIRGGLTAVIVGAPNVGKSSLVNALAKRDVAIVSEEAGTTRDTIEIHLNLDGFSVTLIDTAGLRHTNQQVEAEGIRRAKEKAQHSDIKIAVFDIVTNQKLDSETLGIIDDNTLIVVNKSDQFSQSALPASIAGRTPLLVSAATGDGLEALIQSLKDITQQMMTSHHTPIITRARHREALSYALSRLDAFLNGGPLELITEDLRSAAFAIGKITGKIEVDDILDVVFGSFCIGK